MVGWKKFRTSFGRSSAAAGIRLAGRIRRGRRWRRRRRSDAARRIGRRGRVRRRIRWRIRRRGRWRRWTDRRIVGRRRKVRRRSRRLQYRDERRRRRRRVRGGCDQRPPHASRSTRESRCSTLQRSGIGNRAGARRRARARQRSRPQQRRAVRQRSTGLERSLALRRRVSSQRIASGQGARAHRLVPGERPMTTGPISILTRAPTGQCIVALGIGAQHQRTVGLGAARLGLALRGPAARSRWRRALKGSWTLLTILRPNAGRRRARDRGAALELLQLLAGLLGGYLCEREAAAHQSNGGDQTLRF